MSDEISASDSASGNAAQPIGRRNFLVSALAVVIGGVISLFPLVIGAIPFLDPLRKRRHKGPEAARPKSDAAGFIEVTRLETLPDDGTPMLFKVVSDHVDAWTYFDEEPVGSVYLRKVGAAAGSKPANGAKPEIVNQAAGKAARPVAVVAFNSDCPHKGCAVDFRAAINGYNCPCHNSSFGVDGSRSEDSPSARDLDELQVDVRDGAVWVQFKKFRPGIAKQIEA